MAHGTRRSPGQTAEGHPALLSLAGYLPSAWAYACFQQRSIRRLMGAGPVHPLDPLHSFNIVWSLDSLRRVHTLYAF